MSRVLDRSEYDPGDFDLGERVAFNHEGVRLSGIVVRVYNTRDLYHVEVHGRRYLVRPRDDEMRRHQPQ